MARRLMIVSHKKIIGFTKTNIHYKFMVIVRHY
jgi:hypothetical protein